MKKHNRNLDHVLGKPVLTPDESRAAAELAYANDPGPSPRDVRTGSCKFILPISEDIGELNLIAAEYLRGKKRYQKDNLVKTFNAHLDIIKADRRTPEHISTLRIAFFLKHAEETVRQLGNKFVRAK